MQYASINGNGFGGYGEIVFGTKGTLILEREQDLSIIKGPAAPSSVKVSAGGTGGPTLDTQASGAADGRRQERRRRAQSQPRLHRGVGALGVVHPQSRPGEPAPLRSRRWPWATP